MEKTKKLLIYQYYHHVPDTGKTVNIGYNYHDFSRSSIAEYAKKIGVDYMFIDREIPVSPFYGIFLPFTEGWCHDYDAVCFIDSDILATINAPNIFDYASDEFISINLMTSAKPNGKNLSDVDYFMQNGVLNSGVVVFPRSTYDSLIYHTRNLKEYHESINDNHESIGSLDQAFLNFYIRDVPKEYHDLDKKFNYNLSRNSPGSRFSNYLIHYHRTFKKNVKEDYYNDFIIKDNRVNLDTREIYHPRVYSESYDRLNQVSKKHYDQKKLDYRMIKNLYNRQNVIIRMHTEPYVIHTLFEENKLNDILTVQYEHDDDISQELADEFYEKYILPPIRDKISMYHETKPILRNTQNKFVLLVLPNEDVGSSLHESSEKIFKIANYARCIANYINLPLLVKPHPLSKNANMLGYLMQDNYTVTNRNICDLLDNAEIVITLNSRVGIESLMRMKKTILFDRPSYQEACHVFSDLTSAYEYAANYKLYKNYIKRYLFGYFTNFLGYVYDNDKTQT